MLQFGEVFTKAVTKVVTPHLRQSLQSYPFRLVAHPCANARAPASMPPLADSFCSGLAGGVTCHTVSLQLKKYLIFACVIKRL